MAAIRKMRKFFVIFSTFFLLVVAGVRHATATVGQRNNKYTQIDSNALISAQPKGSGSSINSISAQTNPTTTEEADMDCPTLHNADYLTQTQLITRLTDSCRYDRLEPPMPIVNGSVEPVTVHTRIYTYVLQNLDSSDLQYKIQGLLQLRYVDSRLAFSELAPSRKQPIMGESNLLDLIWMPHIILANEQSSSVLGTSQKDVLISLSPDGTVIISTRIEATLYCWMNFRKFPFDRQKCSVIFESWMYNTSWLIMHWESKQPVTFSTQLQLTEYDLDKFWCNESVVEANAANMRHGALTGNYSTLSFSVLLTREVGYYIMDYFLPSIMIVAISWVTFWLQADQTPARTTLGTTTMLSFITLSLSQENNLSKVSYITLSEVWFLVCTFFIFGSLVEFAFVNTIWRRSNDVELKKRTTKYIIKSAIAPNSRRRRNCQNDCNNNNKSNKKDNNNNNSDCNDNNNNTIITIEPPIIITDMDATMNNLNKDTPSTTSTLTIEDNEVLAAAKDSKELEATQVSATWSTMTPREVSLWIDRKMRFLFPLAFIIFNALFWTLVYCFD